MKTIVKCIQEYLYYSIVLGIFFPCVVYTISTFLFPAQAAGSLVSKDSKIVGSKFIGQSFTDEKYFWGRPSSTNDIQYNPAISGASNISLTHPDFKNKVIERCEKLGNKVLPCPVDLVTSSASGLDPDISVASAEYQIPRVSKARNISPERLLALVKSQIRSKSLGFLGMQRVNVLHLNMELDKYDAKN